MVRLFDTRTLHPSTELSGLWEFAPLDDVHDRPEALPYRLPVPGCWEQHPLFGKYRGVALYRKTVTLAKPTNVRLVFKGVSHTGDVWWDGRHAAHHYNAFTPFSAIIRNAAAGEHRIEVVVDNRFTEASSLHIPNDYYTYGGLTRPVVLEEVGDAAVERIACIPKQAADGRWQAEVTVWVRNLDEKNRTVSVEVALNGRVHVLGTATLAAMPATGHDADTAAPDANLCMLTATLDAGDVQAWTPETPVLYTLHATLKDAVTGELLDDLAERIGFRTVAVRGTDILLNGASIRLKGFNRHEDHSQIGCAIPLQLMIRDLHLMRDMNCNTVRTCHYPNDELFLDLCDELGFLVWEENHARGLTLEQMQNPNFERQCADCIREMIESHVNHPSIVIWGILNECASHTPEGREMYARQFAQIRSLDESRPLSTACCHYFEEICFDLCDIVSLNLYAGWYVADSAKEFYAKVKAYSDTAGAAGKPVIISEFGAAAIYGCHDPNRDKWSEERQQDILEETIRFYGSQEEIRGLIIWQFADCRVSEEWFSTRARTRNNKGVVDEYRRPKLGYQTVKKEFGRI